MSNVEKMFGLRDQTALVTGSSQGIGLALARGFAQAGAAVILNGRSQDKLDKAAKTLIDEGLTVTSAAFDVTDHDAVRYAINDIEDNGTAITILANNAGIQHRSPLEDFAEKDWNRVIDTNLNSVFHVGQAVAKHMIKRKSGKIINTCSLMSELGRASVTPYAASKGGVQMLTRGMCCEWAKYGMQINGIAPGYFKTELTSALVEDAEFTAWLEQRTPAERWGDVEELVGTAVFLAGPSAGFVNGQVIFVDGGITAGI